MKKKKKWKPELIVGVLLLAGTMIFTAFNGDDSNPPDADADDDNRDKSDIIVNAQTTAGLTRDPSLEEHSHEWGEWVVDKEATKNENGERHQTCLTCGENNIQIIYATGSLGLEYKLEEDTYAVVGKGTCTDVDLIIPAYYEGKPVTRIDTMAFWGCRTLTSITLPDSLISIGNSAFSLCQGITSIAIPDSVTTIGDSAFSGCTNLTSIVIPDGVTRVGDNMFMDCSNLTSITIPDSVTRIDYGAFWGCESLTSIVFPDSVTSIGENAFYNCTNLTNVTLGSGMTRVWQYAFLWCPNLSNITYNGTRAQWDSIQKGEGFPSCVIHCIDGDL